MVSCSGLMEEIVKQASRKAAREQLVHQDWKAIYRLLLKSM